MWIYCFAEFGFSSKTTTASPWMAAGFPSGNSEVSAAVAVCNALVRGDATTRSTWPMGPMATVYLTYIYIPPKAGVSQSQFRATCRSISYKKSPSLTRILWYPSSGMNPVMPQSISIAVREMHVTPGVAAPPGPKFGPKKICWPKIGTSKLISQPISHRCLFFLVKHHKICAIFGMLKVAPPPTPAGLSRASL